MVRSLTKRGMPKPFAILVAALLTLYFVPLNALPASAVMPDFEIDGNQASNGGEDWKDLSVGSMPPSGTKTNRFLSTFVDNDSEQGADSTVFGANNKEEGQGGTQWPSWERTDNGNATGKSDYGRVAAYSYVQDERVFLVIGFDRGSNPQGTATANYYFELNQQSQSGLDPNPVRTVGDVRINLNDDGSKTFTASLQKWGGDEWVAASNGDYEIASNSSGEISDLASWWTPSLNAPNGTISPEGFVEASFDLTSFGVVLGCPSSGFTTLNGRSTTGESQKNLMDYFAAQPVRVPSTCANLVINKEDEDGDPLGGAVFRIEPNPLPRDTPDRPSDDFLTIFDDSDDNTAKEGSTNYDDPDATAGRITLPAVVPDVTYTVTEITPPEGYIGETRGKTVTPEKFGGDSVTFVNTLGSVKFFKAYEGPNSDLPEGATFRLKRDALEPGDPDDDFDDGQITVQDNGANDANDTLGDIKVVGLWTGDYRLTEVNAPAGWVADDREVFFTIPGADNEADVVLDSPTFRNPRATFSLTVRKVAESDTTVRVEGAVFELYQETNGVDGLQIDADTLVDNCTTGENGQCSVAGLAWDEDYYWYELSVPAPYNLPDVRVIGPIHLNSDGSSEPSGVTVFADRVSAIETSATNGVLPAGQISDSATLSGIRADAGGSITFRLWDNDTCTGTSVFTSAPVAVNGPGTYGPVTTTVTRAGDYFWIAEYSGDEATGTRGVSGRCGDAGETSTVAPAGTSISTFATPQAIIKLGQTISDEASVAGVTANATGTVTFTLFGPNDDTCAGAPVLTSTVPLSVTVGQGGVATGSAASPPFKPTQAGVYRWIASYSGDADNVASTGRCNDPNERSLVLAGDQPNLDKTSDPVSGSTVQPGSTINYSVKVWNTGDVAITGADVVDILPPHVTVNESSISDGGVLSADRKQITWKVTLAPANPDSTADEKTFTYSVTVNANAPEGAVLVNTARFLGLQDTTSHVVPTGDLTILKEVSPVAGAGVVVEFGDTLTYTLTVTATGGLNQTNVVVTDYVPGFDPEREDSGSTTYVPGSATCLGSGTCTVTEPDDDGLLTWSLGSMAAGSSRQVTFQVTIDDVAGNPGEVVAVDILNAGAVRSTETPVKPSNEVVTPVTKVLPVKVKNPPPPEEEPRVLPRTGSTLPLGLLAGIALALVGLGLALLAGTRRRGAHRKV